MKCLWGDNNVTVELLKWQANIKRLVANMYLSLSVQSFAHFYFCHLHSYHSTLSFRQIHLRGVLWDFVLFNVFCIYLFFAFVAFTFFSICCCFLKLQHVWPFRAAIVAKRQIGHPQSEQTTISMLKNRGLKQCWWMLWKVINMWTEPACCISITFSRHIIWATPSNFWIQVLSPIDAGD